MTLFLQSTRKPCFFLKNQTFRFLLLGAFVLRCLEHSPKAQAQFNAVREVLPSTSDTGFPLLNNIVSDSAGQSFLSRLPSSPDLANPSTCNEGRSKIYYYTTPYRLGKAGLRSLPNVGILEAVRAIDNANERLFAARLDALFALDNGIARVLEASADSRSANIKALEAAKQELIQIAQSRENALRERWRLSISNALLDAGIAVDSNATESTLFNAISDLKMRPAGIVTLSLVRGFTAEEMAALKAYREAARIEIPCLEIRPLSGIGNVTVTLRGTTAPADNVARTDAPGAFIHADTTIAGEGAFSLEVTANGWKALEKVARHKGRWIPAIGFHQQLQVPVPINARVDCSMNEALVSSREVHIDRYPNVVPREFLSKSDDQNSGGATCTVKTNSEPTPYSRFLIENAREKFLAGFARQRELNLEHKEAVFSQLASDVDFFKKIDLPQESVLKRDTVAAARCWAEVTQTCKVMIYKCLTGWKEERTTVCEQFQKEVLRWIEKPIPMFVDVQAAFDSHLSLQKSFTYDGVEPVAYPMSIGSSVSTELSLDTNGTIVSIDGN